jgi:hypothetical protein
MLYKGWCMRQENERVCVAWLPFRLPAGGVSVQEYRRSPIYIPILKFFDAAVECCFTLEIYYYSDCRYNWLKTNWKNDGH